jgi:glycosyltransferase involved in cell wall biosynthesis
VERQTVPVDQIVVVNDGSTDDTDRIAAELGARVDYIRQPNRGVSVARNAGLTVARGGLVLFLDADDSLTPGAIEALLPHTRGGTCVAFGDSDVVDEQGHRLGTLSRPNLAGSPPTPAQRFFAWSGHPPSNFLVPTQAAREVGGFDPRFSYCADSFFLMQVGTVVPFVHVPSVVLNYLQHSANMSRNVRTSVRDSIDSRVAFVEWLEQRGRASVLPDPPSQRDLIRFLASRSFYTREWLAFEETLALAEERKIVDPALRRFRILQRLPRWLFRLQDILDKRQ